jgi:anti-anti-sigma factor
MSSHATPEHHAIVWRRRSLHERVMCDLAGTPEAGHVSIESKERRVSPYQQLAWFDVATGVGDRQLAVLAGGELDIAAVPAMREAIGTALMKIERGESRRLVIDLAHVTFMDAAGIGVLVGASNRARQMGRDVVLRDPTPAALRVLGLTGLLGSFEIERSDSVRALASLCGVDR